MQPAIKMALRIARQGSDYLKAHFDRQEPGAERSEREKQLQRVEQSIFGNFTEQLEKAYKDHKIAELGAADAGDAERSWHIFPVLGRENFLRGIPEFALALLQKKNNKTENVLIVQPISGEEYSASRGHGAALNSRRIRTSSVKHLSESAVVTNLLSQAKSGDDVSLWGEVSAALAREAGDIRSAGCAALDLARVAAGHLDAAIIFKPDPVDLALGLTIAQEAGALIGDFAGNPSTTNTKQVAVANPKLFREVLQALSPYRMRLPR